mmetsp:Transcript_90393/g.260438  ORF Transcript_90393/g.260438 Transcript_90393/m.260438 type:complete len:329 (-) Transcript_90393:170-1156(-)
MKAAAGMSSADGDGGATLRQDAQRIETHKSSWIQASQDVQALAEELNKLATAEPSFISNRPSTFDATFLNAEDELHDLEERFGHDSWQAKLVHFVHGPVVQLILSMLLMLDVVCVIVELFLEAHYPHCQFIQRDAVSCCPIGVSADNVKAQIFRRLSGHGHHDGCASGLEPRDSWLAGCDPHKYDTVHMIHDVCFWITICVLSTFFVELLGLMAALRMRFFKNSWYVLDLVIVVVTLSIEWGDRLEFTHAFDTAKVLILARCWRFVRIGHGLIAETHEQVEREIHHSKKHCQELVEKLHKMHEKLNKAKALVDGLEENMEPPKKQSRH